MARPSGRAPRFWTNDHPPKLDHIRNPVIRIRQAVRDNNVSLLSRLQHKYDLRNTDRNRLTSLSWAAIEGNLEVFEWLLLDWGHDDQELSRSSCQDGDNNTILHLLASLPTPPASHSHHTLLPPLPPTRSVEESQSIAIRMLELYHTLFPFLLDWSNSGGKTPLHVAAQAGNTDFIGVLVELGADVDLTDLQGNSPLHYASAWGHIETVKLLLETGSGFGGRNAEGFTAADYSFSDRASVILQSTARAIWETRRNRRNESQQLQSQIQGQGQGQGQGQARSAATGVSGGIDQRQDRTRSGSVSTSHSGALSTTGSSALSGSGGQGSQGDFISPNTQLMGRDRYFDQSSQQPTRQGSSRSVIHNNSQAERSPSQLTATMQQTIATSPAASQASNFPSDSKSTAMTRGTSNTSAGPSRQSSPPRAASRSPVPPSISSAMSQPFKLQPISGQTTIKRNGSSQATMNDIDATITMKRAGSGLSGISGRR